MRKYPNTKLSWYYLTPKGINIVAQLENKNGKYMGMTITTLTWLKIKKALKLNENNTLRRQETTF